jgi:hypothetical protein
MSGNTYIHAASIKLIATIIIEQKSAEEKE